MLIGDENEPSINLDTFNKNLLARISQLENDSLTEKKKSRRLKMKNSLLVKELNDLKKGMRKYLATDQINAMTKKKIKGWSNSTIKKAIIINQKGGKNLLNFIRNNVVPLPTVQLLRKRVNNFDFKPGILAKNLQSIANDTSGFSPSQKSFLILFDEKAIVPGLQQNSLSEIIGFTTLPRSKDKAVNAMVFLAAGVEVRLKRIVAYHLVGKSINSLLLHAFLLELIIAFEQITGCFCDGLVFDLVPHNLGVLNAFSLFMKKGSTQHFIIHPCDNLRQLMMIPDPVHAAKNFASAFRRSSITIPKEIVKKYNLSSSVANFVEVKKLVTKQKSLNFKPGSKLKHEIIFPNHYETMHEKTASELFSRDVSSTIDFLNKDSKQSATSFMLQTFERWSNIMTSSSYSLVKIKKFEDDVLFLEEFCTIIDNINFRSRLKSQTGSIWSTKSFIFLARQYFGKGMPEVKSSRFLQNALENVFSVTDSLQNKPSAQQFIQSLRSLSVTQFMWNPISGSYNWDAEVFKGKCFLDMLAENKIENEEVLVDLFDEEAEFQLDFEIPHEIEWKVLFKNSLELNAFYFEICKLLESITESVHCQDCRNSLTTSCGDENDGNLLKRLRGSELREPTYFVYLFYMQLEFIFQQLKRENFDGNRMDENFKEIVSNRVTASFEHCHLTTEKIVKSFYIHRTGLKKCRELHKTNKFASKSMQ